MKNLINKASSINPSTIVSQGNTTSVYDINNTINHPVVISKPWSDGERYGIKTEMMGHSTLVAFDPKTPELTKVIIHQKNKDVPLVINISACDIIIKTSEELLSD